jgi:hypothetical protein
VTYWFFGKQYLSVSQPRALNEERAADGGKYREAAGAFAKGLIAVSFICVVSG